MGSDSDDGFDEDDHDLPYGRALHRHAKSVTFDVAPPQVNEYEMVTPDVSSIATSSREGSYDSADDDDDENHYFIGSDAHEDSFDASLEDTVKTPVVLPDDWRQDLVDPMDDIFGSSPLPENLPSFAPGATPQQDRSDSRNSNGDHRPLPPLPGMISERRNSNSSAGLPATAERMTGSQRTLPSPPPPSGFTKADIQNIGNGKMTLEERLKLMMLSDDGKSAAELQRERRMRRGGLRDRADSQSQEAELHDATMLNDTSIMGEDDDTLGELSGLGDYQLPPQISRESILRRVDGNKALEVESDYNFSSPAPSSPERPLPLDPDVPIPSTEDPAMMNDVDSDTQSKQEYDDSDSIIDQYQNSESEVEDVDDDVTNEDVEKNEDSESNYSGPGQAPTPLEEREALLDEGKSDEEVTTPTSASSDHEKLSIDTERGLPELPISQKHNPFTDDLQSYMLPKPAEIEEPEVADVKESIQRPFTPDYPTAKPEYDGSGWGEPDEYDDEEEPKTPDSVIHRPLFPDPEEEAARVSPAIPETVATIKSASGSKLKTRPSATPADIQAMREQRRHVSREVPDTPVIPDRHRNRLSRDFGGSEGLLSPGSSDDYMQRHPSFKSRSLTLDLDLGLSLDQDFDRVIEAQKVSSHQISFRQNSNSSKQSNCPRVQLMLTSPPIYSAVT